MTFWKWVFDLMAAALTKENLARAGAGTEALGGAVTTQIALGSGFDADAEEMARRNQIVSFARLQIGKPYKYGAEVKPGQEGYAEAWDCSECVEGSYRVAGLMIPDGVVNQRAYCQRVSRPLPGDLICLDPNKKGIPHVLICSGEGTVIHALGGVGVVEQPLEQWTAHARFAGYYRHPDFNMRGERC